MGTFGNSNKDREKIIKENLARERKRKEKEQEDYDKKYYSDEKFKRDQDLHRIKNAIISCEWDIKNNRLIHLQTKLEGLKQELASRQEEYNKLYMEAEENVRV